MQKKLNNILDKVAGFPAKYKIRHENIILFACLLILAVYHYSKVGGATDMDEEYYFYISSAISRGLGIYADQHVFYPPVMFYLGSLLFRIFHNIYPAMLTARILITTLSLLGFYFIFDMFKKLRLSWFIIPTFLFMLYSMPLNLTVIKFRPDNILYFVLVLQAYLIFLLAQKERFSDFKIFSILLLSVLSFHITQKAIVIEPLLMLAFLISHFEEIKQFVLKYRTALILGSSLFVLYAIFSASYHRFLYWSYLYIPAIVKSAVIYRYTLNAKLIFLMMYIYHNIAFWLTGVVSFAAITANIRKDRNLLVPCMFIAGTFLYLFISIFTLVPYLQYQLYCIWAILFSLPYFISICCEIFPRRKILIFSVIFLLALSGFFTYGHYWWPTVPLKTYAAEIDRVREVIGREGLASVGGSTINIPTAFPYSEHTPIFHPDFTDLRSTLIKKSTKFIFIDQNINIKHPIIPVEDRYFIWSNYLKCPDLPLMIASKRIYLEPGQNNIDIEIAGQYKTLLIAGNDNPVILDGQKLQGSKVLYLKRGWHTAITAQPAVLLIKINSDKINLECFNDINRANFEFIPLNKVFSGKFELLGMIKYKRSDKLFYQVFWKTLSDVTGELMTFHHFCDSNGDYMTGADIDPTDGWYDIRALKSGEMISYEFSVDMNKKYKSMDIGWFYKQDWSKRIPFGAGTFYRMDI